MKVHFAATTHGAASLSHFLLGAVPSPIVSPRVTLLII